MSTNEENIKLGLIVDEARKMLGELITDVYFDIKRNSTTPNVKVFTEECSSELNKFTEFNEEKAKRKSEQLAIWTRMG